MKTGRSLIIQAPEDKQDQEVGQSCDNGDGDHEEKDKELSGHGDGDGMEVICGMKDVENSVIYTEDLAVLYTVQPGSSVD